MERFLQAGLVLLGFGGNTSGGHGNQRWTLRARQEQGGFTGCNHCGVLSGGSSVLEHPGLTRTKESVHLSAEAAPCVCWLSVREWAH